MKILITGGGGFIGSRLASALLARGRLGGAAIERIVLADQVAPRAELTADRRVEARVGALASQCEALGREGFDGVFHLASAVSGECEADFDLGLRSNLDTTRALLDALRAAASRGAKPARLVFSSSVAVFGPDPSVPLPALVGDDTLPAPKTSYGTHKLMCEHLIADYSRKGFVDGRSARLMTVTVRPGRPNGAASSFFSGIVREPLAGVEAICPVSPEVSHPLTSAARTVEGLIAVYEANLDELGGRLALNLPAVNATVAQMLDALQEVAGPEVRERVRFVRDETIAGIVANWPKGSTAARAARLGLRPDRDFAAIIRQYIADCRAAPERGGDAGGTLFRRTAGMNQIDLTGRVAVITGGAQGIGYAIAERMLGSGATVVLWDADAAKLGEAKAKLGYAGKVVVEQVELTDEVAVAGATRAALAAAKKIDILVNNAGITGGNGTTWELEPAVWRRVLEVNLVGAVPGLPRRRAAHDREEVRPDRQHRLGRRQGRQPQRLALQRLEGGRDRADQVARQGARRQGNPGQLRHAGGGQDGDVRDHEPAAHRLHAVEDPDGPLPRGRRGRRDGRLARLRGLLVHDRLGVRSFRRSRDVLSTYRGESASSLGPARHLPCERNPLGGRCP